MPDIKDADVRLVAGVASPQPIWVKEPVHKIPIARCGYKTQMCWWAAEGDGSPCKYAERCWYFHTEAERAIPGPWQGPWHPHHVHGILIPSPWQPEAERAIPGSWPPDQVPQKRPTVGTPCILKHLMRVSHRVIAIDPNEANSWDTGVQDAPGLAHPGLALGWDGRIGNVDSPSSTSPSSTADDDEAGHQRDDEADQGMLTPADERSTGDKADHECSPRGSWYSRIVVRICSRGC